MKCVLLLWSGLLPLCGAGAEQALELAGIRSGVRGEAAVLMKDKSAAQSSPWLHAGQEWRGYRVLAIDERRDGVTLSRGGEVFLISLRDARVAEAPVALPGGMEIVRGTCEASDAKLTFSADAVIRLGPFQVLAASGRMEYENGVVRGKLFVDENGVRRILTGEISATVNPTIVEGGAGQAASELRFSRGPEGDVVTATLGGDHPFTGAQVRYTYDTALAGWRVSYQQPPRS